MKKKLSWVLQMLGVIAIMLLVIWRGIATFREVDDAYVKVCDKEFGRGNWKVLEINSSAPTIQERYTCVKKEDFKFLCNQTDISGVYICDARGKND